MGPDLYTDFFGFSERPFTLSPDPDFLFWSKSHSKAFTVLEFGIMTHAPLTVVTGEVGAGKTTLIQHMLRAMGEKATIGLISNAQGDKGDLLHWVLYSLGIDTIPGDSYISMFQRFQDYVIEQYAQGRHVILIIDEAQNLTAEALEELRMFTNINSGKDELLQLVLMGQPELREIIARPELRQFAQRVAATYHLQELNATDTRDYIRHRLQHVGGTGDEFSVFATKAIYEESGGVPRIINKLCDLALVYAASVERKVVGIDLIRELLADGLFVKTRIPLAPAPEDTGGNPPTSPQENTGTNTSVPSLPSGSLAPKLTRSFIPPSTPNLSQALAPKKGVFQLHNSIKPGRSQDGTKDTDASPATDDQLKGAAE
jgi:type II secretory pathway predicted ATPase ExeA